MITVGQLAKRYGLARSTLLYYHRIGLLLPSGHRQGDYRRYTEADERRLDRIVGLKSAGLKLNEIKQILDTPHRDTVTEVLENRLMAMSHEIAALKAEQRLTARLLGAQKIAGPGHMTKETWTEILEKAGFSETDMRRWHREFEERDPEGHTAFLCALRVTDDEMAIIRSWAVADR